MAWNTSTVEIGHSTKKSDYDRLRMNCQAIASSTFTFNGTKTFGSRTIFYSPIPSQPSIGVIHLLTSSISIFTTADIGTTNLLSASVASYVPTSTKAVLLFSEMAAPSGQQISFYSAKSTASSKVVGAVYGVGANINSGQLLVPVDTNHKYYWRANYTTVTYVLHYLIGYYI